MICRYLALDGQDSQSIITLSHPTFTRDVWRSTDFIDLGTAVAPIRSCLAVNSNFRADILTAFLSIRTFHAVLSPYANTRISPLSTAWLIKYAPYMQNLILELDMTKLGLGPSPGAIELLPCLRKVEELLKVIGEGQRSRKVPMESFTLLCRRFYGLRPDAGPEISPSRTMPPSRASTRSKQSDVESVFSSPDNLENAGERVASSDVGYPQSPLEGTFNSDSQSSPMRPYCPDELLTICNHLLHLRNQVLSFRMCGFSEKYTHQFVATLFPTSGGRYAHRLTPSGGVWPRLLGQQAWVDIGHGTLVLHNHDTKPPAIGIWDGPVMPPAPIILPDGSVYLPHVDNTAKDTMPRPMKKEVVGLRNASNLSDSTKAPSELSVESEKNRRMLRLLDKCGVSMDNRKRVLSRQTASTL